MKCFKIKIQTMWFIHLKSQLLQAFCKRWFILKIDVVKFELSSRSKIFDLKYSISACFRKSYVIVITI